MKDIKLESEEKNEMNFLLANDTIWLLGNDGDHLWNARD